MSRRADSPASGKPDPNRDRQEAGKARPARPSDPQLSDDCGPFTPGHAAPKWLVNGWLPVIVAVLCYVNSLSNGFTYDDSDIVKTNPRIRSLTNVSAIWLSDWWQPQNDDARIPNPNRDRLYRPLTLFSFALNYAVHGLNAFGFHAVNVGLHALATWLLWLLARRQLRDDLVAALAALLFAVHPVHVEAVANIVGRAEILAAAFLLLALIVLLSHKPPSAARTLAAAALFLVALLAKETAICYPAVALLALHARYGRRSDPESMRQTANRADRAGGLTPSVHWWLSRTAILLAPLLIYLPLRFIALEQHLIRVRPETSLFNPLFVANAAQRVSGALTVLGHYARLLVAPAVLSSDYGVAIVNVEAGFDLMAGLGLLAAGGLLVGLVGYLRPTSPRWAQFAQLAAIFVASYALISNTALLIGVSLAERLMYWPSAPICVALALAGVSCWRREGRLGKSLARLAPLLPTIGAALLVALALRTIVRNPDWSDDFRLFSIDRATFPQGAQLNVNLARHYLYQAEQTDLPEQRSLLLSASRELLETALHIYGRHPEALGYRGRVAWLAGEQEEAIGYLESAVAMAPEDEKTRQLLTAVRGQTQPRLERLAELDPQIARSPDDVSLRLERGRLCLDVGRTLEALEDFERAVRLEPENLEALRLYGAALLLTIHEKEARDVFVRVLHLAPDDWEAHANLAKLFAEDDPAAALRHAKEANRLKPDDLRTRVNLAEAYVANKEYAEALHVWRGIERDLPAEAPYHIPVRERIRDLERLVK
ncbi:MAG: tetratricopeptide repeat protein [Phycisphaerae bacterium]